VIGNHRCLISGSGPHEFWKNHLFSGLEHIPIGYGQERFFRSLDCLPLVQVKARFRFRGQRRAHFANLGTIVDRQLGYIQFQVVRLQGWRWKSAKGIRRILPIRSPCHAWLGCRHQPLSNLAPKSHAANDRRPTTPASVGLNSHPAS
jgi:hypothetical protein